MFCGAIEKNCLDCSLSEIRVRVGIFARLSNFAIGLANFSVSNCKTNRMYFSMVLSGGCYYNGNAISRHVSGRVTVNSLLM